jgi:putative phage-type endonuclease
MNGTAYTIVNLEQGTPDWLEWRRQGIGASDAPAIMGENPWKSPARMLQEKCGCTKYYTNAAMVRGIELEPEARKCYENEVGLRFAPACLQSTRHAWLRASVDGLAADGSAVVEIKCGEGVYRKSSSFRKVPDYYIGQLQHILAVTDLQAIDFWCYLPDRPAVHLSVARDESYIERLLDAERSFWRQVVTKRSEG